MTMPRFGPLPPSRNLTEELAMTLAERIRSGELAPAEKLPTEQEMIAAFGVSRTVVREAIAALRAEGLRSEEHTSELQSLMRISYAVFCLNKKKHIHTTLMTDPQNA